MGAGTHLVYIAPGQSNPPNREFYHYIFIAKPTGSIVEFICTAIWSKINFVFDNSYNDLQNSLTFLR